MSDFDQAAYDLRIGRVLFATSLLVFFGALVFTPLRVQLLTRYSSTGEAGFGQLGQVMFVVGFIAPVSMLLGILCSVFAIAHRISRAKWLLAVEVVLFSTYCLCIYQFATSA